MIIVAGISWAFHGVVDNLRARLKENGNENMIMPIIEIVYGP